MAEPTGDAWEDRCTGCDDTGITIQTERRCACQPPLDDHTRTPPVSMDEVEALKHDLDRARATANELATENVALIEALGELHRACFGRPVGAGDGGTYVAGTPSAATMNKANALLTRIKEAK